MIDVLKLFQLGPSRIAIIAQAPKHIIKGQSHDESQTTQIMCGSSKQQAFYEDTMAAADRCAGFGSITIPKLDMLVEWTTWQLETVQRWWLPSILPISLIGDSNPQPPVGIITYAGVMNFLWKQPTYDEKDFYKIVGQPAYRSKAQAGENIQPTDDASSIESVPFMGSLRHYHDQQILRRRQNFDFGHTSLSRRSVTV